MEFSNGSPYPGNIIVHQHRGNNIMSHFPPATRSRFQQRLYSTIFWIELFSFTFYRLLVAKSLLFFIHIFLLVPFPHLYVPLRPPPFVLTLDSYFIVFLFIVSLPSFPPSPQCPLSPPLSSSPPPSPQAPGPRAEAPAPSPPSVPVPVPVPAPAAVRTA